MSPPTRSYTVLAHRHNLLQTTCLVLRLQVPDVYGVFKYVLDYHHAGYSYINLSQQVLADLSNMLHV